ncbi:hypothetical protein VHEMI04377 [[Torrubiella] hemipterigena]|uniref:Isochorismatase-like domain-containing protein n=1 Tax=[Torrubiella] hemipterigena TaxID=1531966 RepID=A0A0A1TG41_9HYPO|nr:hypothetical protein VHEMI04377 [[Torrubiella] hemipterigena]
MFYSAASRRFYGMFGNLHTSPKREATALARQLTSQAGSFQTLGWHYKSVNASSPLVFLWADYTTDTLYNRQTIITMIPNTAIVLIDPLNDFLHPSGKLYPLVKDSLEAYDALNHIKQVIAAGRAANVPIYYGLHQMTKDGSYAGWNHMNATQMQARDHTAFDEKFGGQILEGLEPELSNGDVVLSRHWNSSSFANTDLEYQLRQRDITKLVFAGLTTNTCLETTARYARELGFHTTLLTDATAAFSVELAEAATKLVWPLIADKLMTTAEWVASVPKDSEPALQGKI